MTEVNNGTSGLPGKPGKSKRGRRAKQSKKSVSNDNESQVTCLKCEEVFTDDDDKLLECERCDSWFCAECLGLSDMEYEVMGKRKDFHWFCADCEKPAISAVKTDKEVEEKCAAYMSSMTDRIVGIEEKLNSKADKDVVQGLDGRIRGLESKAKGEQSSEAQSDTVRETIEEQKERELRKMNIMIQNINESKKTEAGERKAEDIESVTKIFSALGVEEEDVIEQCVRIGKIDPKTTRLTRVTVNSAATKRKILKNAKDLKDNEHYDNVFIGPDLTKMQRAEQYNLRKELRDRKANGEKDLFIRGGKVVQGKEKAVRFRGGASDSATKE